MKDINKNIARNIRNYMDALGITQIELAKRLNCANTTISMWVQGEATPRMDKIDGMCEIFHCTRPDLVSDTIKSKKEIEDDQTRAMFIEHFDRLSDDAKLRLITYMEALSKESQEQKGNNDETT